jgi:hypothetical protein
MSSSRIPVAAAVVCIASIGVGWLLEHRSHTRLQLEHANLAARMAASEEALSKARPDPDAAAASRRAQDALQAEVLRLRGEVSQLRKGQASANTGRRAAQPSASAAVTPPADHTPGTGPGWMASSVPVNGGALFPAWTSANGKQAWVLAIPSIDQEADSNSGRGTALLLQQLIFEGAPEVLANLGIGNSSGGQASGFASFGAEDSKTLLERLKKTDGIDVLSAPRIVTGGGTEAQVSIGNDTGGHLNLSVVPNLAPDGNVDLRIKVERTEGTGQP